MPLHFESFGAAAGGLFLCPCGFGKCMSNRVQSDALPCFLTALRSVCRAVLRKPVFARAESVKTALEILNEM